MYVENHHSITITCSSQLSKLHRVDLHRRSSLSRSRHQHAIGAPFAFEHDRSLTLTCTEVDGSALQGVAQALAKAKVFLEEPELFTATEVDFDEIGVLALVLEKNDGLQDVLVVIVDELGPSGSRLGRHLFPADAKSHGELVDGIGERLRRIHGVDDGIRRSGRCAARATL